MRTTRSGRLGIGSRPDLNTSATTTRTGGTVTEHRTGTREEWLAERLELLAAEKELTRRSDELAQRRQQTAVGADRQGVPLPDRRRHPHAGGAVRRSQPAAHLSRHVRTPVRGRKPVVLGDRRRLRWFGRPPDQPRRVVLCGVAGSVREAPALPAAYGWRFPWASSFGSDFNFDFHVSHTQAEWQAGTVQYERGIDSLWGMYQWLDRAPLGRNESFGWWRRHDEYHHQPNQPATKDHDHE